MDKKLITADEVIIGAGLTGLVYANVLAAKGRKVVVLEKHTKPGGYATNFSRKSKFTFDCSLHKITGFGENGNLSNALERSGLAELINFHPYHHLTTFIIGERVIHLPADGDAFERKLYQEFEDQKNGLKQFFDDIKSHGFQNYMLARMALGEYQLDPSLLIDSKALSKITTYQYLTERFSDQQLISLLCSIVINLGVEAYEADALYFLHFAYTFIYTDKCYVKGSSQSLSDALAKELVNRGGELLNKEEINQIKVKDNKATGCISRRYNINADKMTFTGCPHQITQLLPRENLPTDFIKKLDKLEFGLGSFFIYLGLSVPPEQIGFTEQDYLICSEDYLSDAKEACHSDLRYSRWPLSISNYHALDPSYGYVIQLGVLDQQADWFKLNRSDYKARKKDIAQLLLARAEQYFPELKQHITYMDISTPKTNYKFTNSGGGSSFGYKPVPKRNMRFLKRPPVEQLQFVGTWMNGAGYEPAMCLGFTIATLSR